MEPEFVDRLAPPAEKVNTPSLPEQPSGKEWEDALWESLAGSLPAAYTRADRALVERAFRFAANAHRSQKRASGEPYITHCVAVAKILAGMNFSPAVVVAGLLHDTAEDTDVTLDDIAKQFGDEVARLVDAVTKLTKLPNTQRMERDTDRWEDDEATLERDAQAKRKLAFQSKELRDETLRKIFLAMGDDIRVVFIKLADRLHNMRTLSYLTPAQQKAIARETMDIYAPLANRLGIWEVKAELEDLAFRYLEPEKYEEIAEKLASSHEFREKQIQQIIRRLEKILREAGVEAEIQGRPKHIYSIYKKMTQKGETFEMIRDLRGVRLIVKDVPSCYAALGVVHTNWRPIPHELDDYIASPKDNFYQSLHTAVWYDDGKPLEVQIRTPDMHRNAEFGVAAHWRYKESEFSDRAYASQFNDWLQKLMVWKEDVEDAHEFVEGMKTDVFQDRVYVFTPKGDVIDLPAGSTPIDFAYHIHTEVGHRCRGARVNGKLVSLDTTLKTGDIVEIIAAKQGGPSRDWLNPDLGLVHTQRARSKIRQWFKEQDREQNLAQGKGLLEKELRRLGISSVDYQKLAESLDYKSIDDLYVAIGSGDLSSGRAVNALSEINREVDLLQPRVTAKPVPGGMQVSVEGQKGLLLTYAGCCHPAPGDPIAGYITRGHGITIHRVDCPNFLRIREPQRIVSATWDQAPPSYAVLVEVKAYDRQGLMRDISNVLADESIDMLDVQLNVTHNLASFRLKIAVESIAQLSKALARIENLPNVMEAHRLKPGSGA